MRTRRSRTRMAVAAAAGVLGLLVGTTVFAASPEPTDEAKQQPIPPTRVTEADHPDPAVVEIDGEYWTYATFPPCPEAGCPSDNRKVRIRKASTIEGPYDFVDLAMSPIPWADNTKAIFAPDVRDFGDGRVVLYFSAVSAANDQNGQRCIGAAVSTNGPGGPFEPEPQPVACDEPFGGIIDPAYFQDPVSGDAYLLYKTNVDPSDSSIRRIWIQEVTADGLTTVGERRMLAERTHNIENPEIVYSGRRYFLFVSRDLYRTSDYKTSVLVSTSVDQGYADERAVLTSQNTNVSGPGGADILQTQDGRTFAYHHGWIARDQQCDGYRPMYVSELAWDANDRLPHLAVETPGNPQCYP